MTTTSPLPDPRTPVSVPAGSTHVRTRRVRMHARTHAHTGPMHARTHALGLCMHARTGPVHAAHTGPMHARMHQARAHCTHWAYACMHAPGPCMLLALGPHAHSLVGPIVKPAAGRCATSDFSCELINKRAEGPLGMRVDC